MKKSEGLYLLTILAIAALALLIYGGVIFLLWNLLIVPVFSLAYTITYGQALVVASVLEVISSLLGVGSRK